MNCKTLWISDLHLGTRHCDATGVLEFLKHHECERLYLVGDIVDLWHLRRNRFWPQTHNDVIQKLLRKARKGVEVIWIPGNHDEFCANFAGAYGNLIVKPHDLHVTADGRRLLVLHGHEFDAVIAHAKWLAHLGDVGYTLLLKANLPLNHLRSRLGLSPWSVSAYAKSRVKKAVSFIGRFQEVVAHYAERHHADGIVCGHIHTPAVTRIGGIAYYNCGDWVESRTGLVEHSDGRIELVRWRRQAEAIFEAPELELVSVGES